MHHGSFQLLYRSGSLIGVSVFVQLDESAGRDRWYGADCGASSASLPTVRAFRSRAVYEYAVAACHDRAQGGGRSGPAMANTIPAIARTLVVKAERLGDAGAAPLVRKALFSLCTDTLGVSPEDFAAHGVLADRDSLQSVPTESA